MLDTFKRMRACLVAAAGLVVALSSPATSQERNTTDKDPAIALGFAWLCPGCGHLYSGETTRGAVIAAISIGSLASGAAIQFTRSRSHAELAAAARAGKVERMDLTPILVGGAISLVGYVYGLIDAGPSVRRANARSGIGFRGIDMSPTVAADGSVGARFTIPLTTGQ